MVWAGEGDAPTAAMIPIMKRYNVLQTSVNDGDDACEEASACPNLYTQNGPNSAPVIADAEAIKKLGYTKIGILADSNTFTASELAFMEAALKSYGIGYTVESFPDTVVSVTPEMSALKAANVPFVYALALGPSAGYTLSARASLGWNVPIEFDITGSGDNIPSLVPSSDLSNATETIADCEDLKNTYPAYSTMMSNAPQAFPSGTVCLTSTAGWDGLAWLADVAAKAGSVNEGALLKAANGISITKDIAAYNSLCWTTADHEDVCENPNFYEVVPIGQLKNTRLYPLS
jgi:ABC-type branched-subunit amino acid transport system substrate-binding protein